MKLTRKIKKVQEELTAKVVGEYRHAVEVSVLEEPGPFGIKVIVACNPKAHPGTGMKKVLMDETGITYGVHGESDLATLVRKKGWLDPIPDPKLFLRLVNLACFDGIAMLPDTEARFSKTPKGTEFHFVKIEHPSGKRVAMTLFFLAA